MDRTVDRYAIIEPYEVNEYYKKGYDFVTVYYEESNPSYSGSGNSQQISGTFMNNPINFNLPQRQESGRFPKFLMMRNEASAVLFGNNK